MAIPNQTDQFGNPVDQYGNPIGDTYDEFGQALDKNGNPIGTIASQSALAGDTWFTDPSLWGNYGKNWRALSPDVQQMILGSGTASTGNGPITVGEFAPGGWGDKYLQEGIQQGLQGAQLAQYIQGKLGGVQGLIAASNAANDNVNMLNGAPAAWLATAGLMGGLASGLIPTPGVTGGATTGGLGSTVDFTEGQLAQQALYNSPVTVGTTTYANTIEALKAGVDPTALGLSTNASGAGAMVGGTPVSNLATTAGTNAVGTAAGNAATGASGATGATGGASGALGTGAAAAGTAAAGGAAAGIGGTGLTAGDIIKAGTGLAGIALAAGGGGTTSGANTAADNAANAAAAAQTTLANISQDQWNYYKQNYQPLESNLINQAMTAGSPDEFARARGAASADVTGAFDTARKSTLNRMQSYGINPGSPAYQSMGASTDLAEGATRAGALTAADNATRNLAYSKALDVAGIGRNIPAQSAASSANAANAATNAAQVANTRGQTAFLQNQTNNANIGYGLNSIGNAAAKWFGTPTPVYNSSSSLTPGSVNTAGGNTDWFAGAEGGKVTPRGFQRAGLEVAPWGIDLRTGRPATTAPEGSNVVETRPAVGPSHPTHGNGGSIGTRNEGVYPEKRFADGGTVIDAQQTAPGEYDATALHSVLMKRGLNPRMAHAATRHITPHMRHFAGGGGVGRQGIGLDESDMGMPNSVSTTAQPVNGVGTEEPQASNGRVEGPGSGTSDSVPAVIDGQQAARLSDGEFIMSEPVSRMTGEEILMALNEAGLKKRGIEPKTSNEVPVDAGMRAYRNGGRISRFACGGLF